MDRMTTGLGPVGESIWDGSENSARREAKFSVASVASAILDLGLHCAGSSIALN